MRHHIYIPEKLKVICMCQQIALLGMYLMEIIYVKICLHYFIGEKINENELPNNVTG